LSQEPAPRFVKVATMPCRYSPISFGFSRISPEAHALEVPLEEELRPPRAVPPDPQMSTVARELHDGSHASRIATGADLASVLAEADAIAWDEGRDPNMR
jgi:hypothetical protein